MQIAPKCLVVAAACSMFLVGCSPREMAEHERLKGLEHDSVPTLYQGPLVVTYRGRMGTLISYSERSYRRIEMPSPSGHGYSLDDPVQGRVYFWMDFGRHKDQVRIRAMTKETRAVLARWNGRTTAQRLGACSAAGETGKLYRVHSGPGIKGLGIGFGEACITDDGVVLEEAQLTGDLSRRIVEKEAERVSRAPLPAGIFDPPV